ncbi:unnamed protein product [Phytophthora fragariaefolia]|uniref:Unnamed protein product n=1 Tax=Phytophthora fragariaefolia TaxID=1490495 RepID=A0A9W6XVU9_9STRA|nr:unnamed protein product [Phytophthora fragariaefolia]
MGTISPQPPDIYIASQKPTLWTEHATYRELRSRPGADTQGTGAAQFRNNRERARPKEATVVATTTSILHAASQSSILPLASTHSNDRFFSVSNSPSPSETPWLSSNACVANGRSRTDFHDSPWTASVHQHAWTEPQQHVCNSNVCFSRRPFHNR